MKVKTLFITSVLATRIVDIMTPKDYLTTKQPIYLEFISKFGKSYNTEEEYKLREEIYNQNVYKIQQFNSNPSKTYTLGVNKFTDLTD